jgi:superfamily II DNA or RNA helicase
MINQKRILQSDIRHACGDTYFSRGKKYFDDDRVLDLYIEKEESFYIVLSASIEGSRSNYYDQDIRINWKKDYSSVSIDGNCSCPMSFNCKHIVAVCLAYMGASGQAIQPVDATPSCMEWLNDFDTPEVTHDDYAEFIAYILTPSKTVAIFTLNLQITKENKKGGLNKGRKTTLDNLRYSYSYTNYIQPIDQEIAIFLSSLRQGYQGVPELVGSTGFIALSKILQTGRLFWQSHQSPPIQRGDERSLDFLWEQQKNKAYKLKLAIEHQASLILTDPPLYFDEQQNTLGAISALDISDEQLKKIVSAPAVPEEHVDEFSHRLTLEFPSIPLPAPKKIDITELSNLVPTPKLTLFGQRVNQNQYSHFIQLNFNYDDKTVSAYTPDPFCIVKIDGDLFRIQRDIDTEFTAFQQLLDLGFTPAELSGHKELVFLSPADGSTIDSANRWAGFIQNSIPQLEDQGWIIETDDNFKLNFQTAEDWQTEIEETNNDWFQMNFKVNVNGQSIPLLPLIMPVIENYDLNDLPESLSIPIEEHTYINIPSSQLKPFLDIVYELFDSASMNENGSLTLSRFNAATLAEIDSGNYGLFSIKGGKALLETGKKLKNFKGIANVDTPKGLNASLRDYQQLGLNWLQFLREYNFAGILADDMGLGKTVQTLAHLMLEKEAGRMSSPCLIIAPTSLMGNWRREAARFTPDLKVLTLQGAERKQHFDKIKDYDLILTTYPLLPRDKETLIAEQYHYLVLDEAQVIKNPKSQAARTVREIKTTHRLCLTGTPMENHLGELWAQFDFLMPGFLGDSAFFKKIYRTPIEMHGDQQQRERLSKRLQPFMLRRTKQEVATELPPKTEIIRSIPLYDKQAALYESIRITMEKKVRDAIANKGLARSHITILDALLKLRQTCCDPRTLSLKEAQKITESAKLDLLMEMLPEQLEEGRRILVFSQFTKMIALIEKELDARKIEYSKLTGQTKKRDEAIERFKSGEADVFLISLKAGGVGLNLTEADTVIMYDPWWNPAVETQAADRAHRIGQDKPVFVYKLITENTVEEKILAMQEKKRALADSIYNGGKKEQSLKLTSDDLTELFKPLS